MCFAAELRFNNENHDVLALSSGEIEEMLFKSDCQYWPIAESTQSFWTGKFSISNGEMKKWKFGPFENILSFSRCQNKIVLNV